MSLPIEIMMCVNELVTLSERWDSECSEIPLAERSAIPRLALTTGATQAAEHSIPGAGPARPFQDPSAGCYRGLGVTLIGGDGLLASIARGLAGGGIAELSLASTDILESPIAPLYPRDDSTIARRRVARSPARINPKLSLISFSGRNDLGAHWLRCAAARSDLVIQVESHHYAATSRLVNLICHQQVKPALYARFDSASATGEILWVNPRGSGLHYRGVPATRCWECSAGLSLARGAREQTSLPAAFKRIVMQYVDALLLEKASVFAALLDGANCLEFRSGRAVASGMSPSGSRSCNVCG